MDADKTLKDLNLSEDEVKRITEAFKKEEFRKLFAEYAEEISNPENRKRYEEEIAQLEAERGMNVKFVRPEPGHVIKTTVNGDTKAFINVCKNDHIEKPSANKQRSKDGKFGLQWSIPHSFSPPRDDTDKSGKKCRVFDVVFHPDTYRMGETNISFRKMLHDTAFDGIERQFEVVIDRNNLKFPKIKFKGIPSSTVIRTKSGENPKEKNQDDIMNNFPYPYDDKTTEEKSKEREEKMNKVGEETSEPESVKSLYTTPKYKIKHRSEVELDQFRNAPDAKPSTRPTEIVVEVDIPLLKSAAPIDLDIFEKQLVLKSEEPAKYMLDLALPYPVDDSAGSAKFDKSKRKLVVTLPVVPDKAVDSFFDEMRHISSTDGEVNGHHVNESKDEGKPLIEVLSSTSTVLPDGEMMRSSTEHNGTNSNDEVIENGRDMNKDIWSSETTNPGSQKVSYTMPDYEYDQDVGTVSFVIEVKNVQTDSIVKNFPCGDQKQINLKFVSMGSGCFPIHYSIFLKFEEGCNIIPEHCTVDVSADNVVMILAKAKLSWSWWEKFEVGVDESDLQEKYFITEKTLKAEFDELGGASIMPAEQATCPKLHVSEMNADHVTVEIKDRDEVSGSNSPESDVEIIHQKAPPKLHSILKQRSRTTSESSDEVFSSSFSRENSMASESPISEGDEEVSGTGRKKSVSFSEQVDRTSYRSNASVTALHSALKNKRKNARKRDERTMRKMNSRRRRTSSGGSYSSDDLSSSGHPDEFDLGDDDLDPHAAQHSEKKDMKKDENAKSAHTPKETKQQVKKESSVAKNKAAAVNHTGVREQNKNLGEDGDSGQKADVSAEQLGAKQLDEERSSVLPPSSITNENDTSANKVEIVNEKEVFRDSRPKSEGYQTPDKECSATEGRGHKKSKNKRRKQKNRQVRLISGGSDDEDDKSSGDKVSETAEKGKKETQDDSVQKSKSDESNEHKTQCAFQFCNSLMYDLDDD